MEGYKKITFWQNISYRKYLNEYQSQVKKYFGLIDYDYSRNIIDNEGSRKIRTYLNRQNELLQKIFLGVGLSPNVIHTPPPAIGGLMQRINLIDNLFNLQNYDIEPQELIDFIDQIYGVYERDFLNSIIRTLNPFYWLGRVLEIIASVPFYLLGQIGFNQHKLESSLTGQVIKLLIKILSIVSLFWGLLSKLEILPDTFDLSNWLNNLKI